MPRLCYPWKRFWYPVSADFRLSDGGYLTDPEGEYGQILNPDAESLETISNSPCLVLLGEPGIGKSNAIQSLQSSDDTLSFDLGDYQTDTSLAQEVFRSQEVQAWLRGTHSLVLSLDSLDEGRLAVPNLAKVLLRELKKLKGNSGRLSLRIACRTADWPTTLEEGLKEIWDESQVRVYQLSPLRRKDVTVAAELNGINAVAFLSEIEKREAVALAIKPITLSFLLNCFKRDGRFPATRAGLYLEGCRTLCEETDNRRDAGAPGNLTADQRMGIAARIAALTVFGGFSAVWNGADRGDAPEGDLTIRRISKGTERVGGIELPVDDEAVREVIGTGLFHSRGTHRLGWSHYTYAEFLAAQYLVGHDFTLAQVKSLISVPGDREGSLAPQLHETASWLANMRPDAFQWIMDADPSVLLLSDVAAADQADRAKLVATLLALFDKEKLLDSKWGLRSLYRKLAHPGLADQLLLLCDMVLASSCRAG